MTGIQLTGPQAKGLANTVANVQPSERVWVFSYDEYIIVEVETSAGHTLKRRKITEAGDKEALAPENWLNCRREGIGSQV